MKRAVLAALLCAAAAPAVARAEVAHPNPAFVSPQVDYVAPLRGADGGLASLPPLDPAVTAQAVADQAWLAYQRIDDLGGFVPAPVGDFALSSGGRNVVGGGGHRSELPQFAQAAGGDVRSFAFLGAAPGPPDSGTGEVPGLGVPPVVPPPTNDNTVPPPNQGFGGRPPERPGTTTTTTTTTPVGTTAPPPGTTTAPKPPPPPPTTTPPTTPTGPPTTTTPTTTPGGGGGGGGGGPASCGVVGLSLTSDLADCRIYAVNMSPGDATSEHVTIRNESGEQVTLSLRASGTTNPLWNELQMGVWEQGDPAPSPLPALLWWTTQENQLTTLQPGESVTFVVELALPASAGNDVQGLAAVIDFHWHAQA